MMFLALGLFVLLIAGAAFTVWWFFIRKKGLSASDILRYDGLILYEWRDAGETGDKFDRLNLLLGNYLVNGKDGEDLRGQILSMSTRQFIGSTGGTLRYSWFILQAVEAVGDLMTQAERDYIFDEFVPVIRQYQSNPELWKQEEIVPSMDTIKKYRPNSGILTTTTFINADDHQPYPTEASSHYGFVGWYFMLWHSILIGKLSTDSADLATLEYLRYAAVSRFAYGREWFRIFEGGTWEYSVGLLLMSVCSDDCRERVKGAIQRKMQYAIAHGYPVCVFAGLLKAAKWDDTKADTDFDIPAPTLRKLSDGRAGEHQAQRAYRTDNWWICQDAYVTATVSNNGIRATLNIAPGWAGKNDFGIPGEVVSICNGKEEIINSPISLGGNPPVTAHSCRTTGGNEVHIDHYDQEHIQITSGGFRRWIESTDKGIRINDQGTGKTIYRLTNVKSTEDSWRWETDEMVILLAADNPKISYSTDGNRNGFYSACDYTIEAEGAVSLTVEKK